MYQWYKYANKLHFNILTIHTRHIYVETLKTRDAHTNEGERCGSSCQRERERERKIEREKEKRITHSL